MIQTLGTQREYKSE